MKKFLIFVLFCSIIGSSNSFAEPFNNLYCHDAAVYYIVKDDGTVEDMFGVFVIVIELKLKRGLELINAESDEIASIEKLQKVPKKIESIIEDGITQFDAEVGEIYQVSFILKDPSYYSISYPDDYEYLALAKVTGVDKYNQISYSYVVYRGSTTTIIGDALRAADEESMY